MKKYATRFMALCGFLMMLPAVSFNQDVATPNNNKLYMHREVQDDPYLPNPYGNKKTSPAKKYKSTGIFTTQVNVNAGGENIMGDAGNEPSLAVDPSNPNRMVIGWRQFDNVYSNFRQAGYGYSADAGQTWTFPGKIEAGIFRSDPVLGADTGGFIYYNSLTSNSGLYTCKVFKSDDGGALWNTGAEAQGGDKQWMTIDRSGGPGTGNIYSSWTSYYSSCYPGFFTRSIDGGNSFEWCEDVPGNPYWGTMTVGNDGELYIAGSGNTGGIVVVKSTTAWDPGFPVGFDSYTQVNMDGYITSGISVNPGGLLGQASIDVDRSNGPGRDNVYVLSSMVRLSNSDSADVMFSKSTDGGATWSFPIRINDDPGTGNYQWFGTMSTAPDGRIDAIWLDTRDAPGTVFSALYYSYSIDQGETWSVNERLSESFDPHVGWPQQNKMGDYFDMESDATGAHLAWANTLNGEQDVYYSYINPGITGLQNDLGKKDLISLSSYPNPFSSQTTISYTLSVAGEINMVIYDVFGKVVKTLVDEIKQAGTYHLDWASDLPPGFYECRLSSGTQTKHIGLVKSR
jgi:hypothetical protein